MWRPWPSPIKLVLARCVARSLEGNFAHHPLPPSTPQLVDMRWKVAVSTSSRFVSNPSRCYVAVDLHVADPSGQISVHSFEMSLAKFKVGGGLASIPS